MKAKKTKKTNKENPNQTIEGEKFILDLPLQRFKKSMEIDYEKWNDGIGYDIDAIKLASETERKTIEQLLIIHNPRDWRDIEALAEINTESAQETIKKSMKDPNADVRTAVTRYAPNLVTNSERTQSIIKAVENAEIFGGLSKVLDDIEEYHPREIKEALIKGLLSRKGKSQFSSLQCSFIYTEKQKSLLTWSNAHSFFNLTLKTKKREKKYSRNYANN